MTFSIASYVERKKFELFVKKKKKFFRDSKKIPTYDAITSGVGDAGLASIVR